jgi:hypothetical protein
MSNRSDEDSVTHAPTPTRGRFGEISRRDSQAANLIAQGVPMNTQRLGGTGETALVCFQGCDNKLFFEFAPGLIERQPAPHQFIYDLYESTVQVLLHHHIAPRYL